MIPCYVFITRSWIISPRAKRAVKPSMRSLQLLIITLCSSLTAAQQPRDLQHARRLIVVTTSDWNTIDGKLTRYSRFGEKWKQVGEPIPMVVGKNGLAWD